MNSTNEENTELLSNRSPDGITTGPTRVLAEPSRNGMLPNSGVWSARVESGNLQTGVRFSGLPAPASVSQTPNQCTDPQNVPSAELDNGEGGWNDILAAMEWEDDPPQETPNQESDEEDNFFNPETRTPQRRRRTPPHRTNTQRIQGPILGIKIASLNMRGRNCTTGPQKGKDKFNQVRKWMREHKITILTLIDTHWDETFVTDLKTRSKALQFFCSHESTNRGGIAFIVDVSVWKPVEIKFTNLIQGRSALLRARYTNDELNIATVYVPNKKEEKIETLTTLRNKLRDTPNLENLILTGDFNMVESEIDRRPSHPDDPDIVNEMNRLKIELGLIDGWRRANPHDREHTWSGHTSDNDTSFARINRIYISETISMRTNEWDIIDTTKSLTDHKGVTVKILEPEAPFLGKGEQRFNVNIINSQHFRDNALKALTKLDTELQNYRAKANHVREDKHKLNRLRESTNPQISWTRYKRRLMTLSKEASEMRKKAIAKERNELERKRRALVTRPANLLPLSIQKEIRSELDKVEREISDLKERHQTKAEDTTSAKWFKENEQGSKAWFALNKDKPPAQTFYSLVDKTGKETRNTDDMMEIAKDHHKNLQSRQPMPADRIVAIDELLGKVKQRISRQHAQLLEKKLTYDEILNTVKSSKNGKSPGCDGIPNEVWKDEVKMYEKAIEKGERRPDLIKLLKIVLLDIDEYGPINLSFAEARMSLLSSGK